MTKENLEKCAGAFKVGSDVVFQQRGEWRLGCVVLSRKIILPTYDGDVISWWVAVKDMASKLSWDYEGSYETLLQSIHPMDLDK